jgi:hypothetical protein
VRPTLRARPRAENGGSHRPGFVLARILDARMSRAGILGGAMSHRTRALRPKSRNRGRDGPRSICHCETCRNLRKWTRGPRRFGVGALRLCGLSLAGAGRTVWWMTTAAKVVWIVIAAALVLALLSALSLALISPG